ncbi:hypothetical protein [Streptomyces sp. NBC_01264]|uniref:hypothetical protein n=1 Tax=Streptomyces sp. NBC_01264 TaxID=2903804 RepID=UPI00224E869C|nr:hypothetical protein [Streptomyces sp. NBC_01264]MCX4777832.1 hypothetical protein [Streptomyces sp. NBC_01264]
MGMTVLYIAFGFVALWLLAEVLMQYKARLRWRLLAFAGFVGVVAGVVLPSVLVIGAGAVAFAIGQTLVTLSFRKGFVSGWALRRGKAPEPELPQSRRRRSGGAPRPEPALEVTALEYGPDRAGDEDEYDKYADGPDEDSGAFTGGDAREQVQGFHPGQPAAAGEPGPYGVPGETSAFASPFAPFAPAAEQDAHQYAAYYDPQTQGGYDYTTGYPPPGEQQVYAAYSDPYIGTGGAVAPQQPYGYAAPYDAYAPDPYATTGQQEQYSMDTPPGGVWVPQQRDVNQPYPAEDQQQPYPYPYQGTGDYEQYRY